MTLILMFMLMMFMIVGSSAAMHVTFVKFRSKYSLPFLSESLDVVNFRGVSSPTDIDGFRISCCFLNSKQEDLVESS